MAGYYMKEMTVPIPDDRRAVIRREKQSNMKSTGTIRKKRGHPRNAAGDREGGSGKSGEDVPE